MLLASLLSLMLQGAPPASEVPRVLGVLETPQVEGGPAVAGRLLFERVEGRWRPLTVGAARALPPSMWAVAYQGRKVGSVDLASDRETEGATLREGLLRPLTDPTSAPRIMERVETFGGWMKVLDRRPLVIQPATAALDPDGWSLQPAPENIRTRLWPDLRKAWGTWRPVHCPKDPERPAPLNVKPQDLHVTLAFRARDGRWIVALGLDSERSRCDGILDPEWSDHWFLMEGGRVTFLGRELAWVDAGDFSGTGRSDILFALAGYNRDGYVLWSDGLKRRVEITWSYH